MSDHPPIYFVPVDRPTYTAALSDEGSLAIFFGTGGIAVDMSAATLRALAERALVIADAMDAREADTIGRVDAALSRIVQEAGHA